MYSHLKRLCLVLLFLAFLVPAYSQNTKGDQPAKQSRETRFKSKPKKKKTKASGKRISSKGKSKATSGAQTPNEKGRAWESGDITGRKIPAARSKKKVSNVHAQGGRTVKGSSGRVDDSPSGRGGGPPKRVNPRSSTGQTRNVYPQRGPYVKKTKPPSSDDKAPRYNTGTSSQRKIKPTSGRTANIYPKKGAYSVKSKPPAKGDKPMKWTGSTVSKPKVRTPNNKSKNVYPRRGQYATSPTPGKSDTRKKWTGGGVTKPKIQTATGKTKNVFKQTGPYVNNPSIKPQLAEKPPGKKRKMHATASKPFMRRTSINPYAGFWNKKQKGEKAYVGDISGKKLRARNYETPKYPPIKHTASPLMKKKRVGDVSYSGKAAGGYVSASKGPQGWRGDISGRKLRDRNQSSKGKLEAGKPFGKLPTSSKKYSGYSKARKSYRASASGKHWNNRGQAIEGKGPGMGAKAGTFQGNLKQQKPLQGGGSISGGFWNNRGQAIEGRAPGQGARAASFQGNIKAQKPLKGGGSVSGGFWNNQGKAIEGREPRIKGVDSFQGSIKAQKPLKGGGSVSGKLWNNNEKPIAGREPKVDAMGNYQGNVRATKKEPGKEIGGFPGKYKLFDLEPSMRNQGEEFTGHIRRPRLWSDYITHKGTAKASIKKKRPTSNTYAVGDLHVRAKEKEYKKKPNAAEGSMPGIAPGKTSIKASEYARGVKQDWNYIRNKSSDEDALKVKEPGRAFGKASDYQGNIKMQKFDLFGRKNLHPDAQFVKTNKNNVKEEKNLLTNFKLLWARLFKKNDTQPNHLKENIRKPRYDKDEIGLWNN